ncbi:MAG: multidrug transporter [Bacteroidota bacterium]
MDGKKLQENTDTQLIPFSPRAITRVLVCCIALLALAHIAAFIEDYVRHAYSRTAKNIIKWFDFNRESNVPTWFSLVILTLAALLFFIIYTQKKNNKIKGAHYWLTLGFIFIFLSIDESVQVHEEVAKILRPSVSNNVSGLLYWAWVIPYGIFAIAAAIYFFRFVVSLPAKTRNLFFLAGGMYVFGALILELVEGHFYIKYGLNHIYNRILYFIEELCEMGGVTVLIYALLSYMADHNISIAIRKK